jgi:hypothetical protein
MRLHERENQHFLDVLGFVRRVAASDRPSDDALLRWRSQIDTALVGVLDREQIGRQLQKRYKQVLSEK